MTAYHSAPMVTGVPDQVFAVLEAAGTGALVAGGAARAAILPVEGEAPPPADVDLFLLDEVDAAEVVTTLSAVYGEPVAERPGLVGFQDRRLQSDGAYRYQSGDLPVEVMTASGPYGPWATFDQILDSFGFTTEQFGIYLSTTTGGPWGIWSEAAEADTLSRTLRINHVVDPVKLAMRLLKYGAKGYHLADPREVVGLFDLYHELALSGDLAEIRNLWAPSADPEGEEVTIDL